MKGFLRELRLPALAFAACVGIGCAYALVADAMLDHFEAEGRAYAQSLGEADR